MEPVQQEQHAEAAAALNQADNQNQRRRSSTELQLHNDGPIVCGLIWCVPCVLFTFAFYFFFFKSAPKAFFGGFAATIVLVALLTCGRYICILIANRKERMQLARVA